jgi:PKD domain
MATLPILYGVDASEAPPHHEKIQQLTQKFRPPVHWRKLLKYAVPVIVVLGALLWNPMKKKPRHNFVALTANSTESEASNEANFENSANNADAANFSRPFNDNDTDTVKLKPSSNGKVDATTRSIVVGATGLPQAEQAQAPIAKFIPNRTNCRIPCNISFTNQSQNATAYNWDFGDGSSSTDANPSHLYAVGGDYQIRLVALRDDQRIEATAKIKVEDIMKVEPRNIVTASNDASLVAGDREIDSDDWTSVEVSYSLTIVNERREVQLRVEWYAQERNKDKSKGNTRFMSSKNYTVFNVASCCPGTLIENVTGIDLSAEREHYFQGEAHGYKPYPSTGSLRNIKVKFDGPQSNDQTLQALTATLAGFSVKIKASN